MRSLNERVFFWPATAGGAIKHGERHARAYDSSEQVALRVGFRDLVDHNPECPPWFCRYNSGAPRVHNGRRSPRGPDTFQLAQDTPLVASLVAEVSFVGRVKLPTGVEFRTRDDAWRPLWA